MYAEQHWVCFTIIANIYIIPWTLASYGCRHGMLHLQIRPRWSWTSWEDEVGEWIKIGFLQFASSPFEVFRSTNLISKQANQKGIIWDKFSRHLPSTAPPEVTELWIRKDKSYYCFFKLIYFWSYYNMRIIHIYIGLY